jgi:hypothetical protein
VLSTRGITVATVA